MVHTHSTYATAWASRGEGHGLTEGPIGALAIAPDGSVWIGGDGVSRLDGDVWTHFSLDEMGVTDVRDYGVMSLAVGLDGAVWAGTDVSGAFRYDGETWTAFDERDGLADDSVFSIAVAADGAVWFGTENGISRYSPE